MTRNSSATLALAGFLLGGTLAGGCTMKLPTNPSATAAASSSQASDTGMLTVRVLARTSEQPIAGATVQAPGGRATTDASGLCVLQVSRGETVDVNVSADGYQSMGASGVLGSNERWTFYLPPASAAN